MHLIGQLVQSKVNDAYFSRLGLHIHQPASRSPCSTNSWGEPLVANSGHMKVSHIPSQILTLYHTETLPYWEYNLRTRF